PHSYKLHLSEELTGSVCVCVCVCVCDCDCGCDLMLMLCASHKRLPFPHSEWINTHTFSVQRTSKSGSHTCSAAHTHTRRDTHTLTTERTHKSVSHILTAAHTHTHTHTHTRTNTRTHTLKAVPACVL